MASKKPQFVIRTEQEILEKLKYMAKNHERSATQEAVFIIKQAINKYEKENGEIKILED